MRAARAVLREALALGRMYAASRRGTGASAAYRHALALSRPGSVLRIEVLRALAEVSRQAREHQTAAHCWQQLLDAPECPGPIAHEAARALAIHHEHRLRDLDGARAFAMRSLYHYEREQLREFIEEEPAHGGLTLRRAIAGYAVAGLVVVAAGSWLPFVGAALAEQMGWGQSFVATLFVAAVTATPELVVTLAALRLGAVDMAIGNLLGSNLANIAILAITDVFYLPGALFSAVSPAHAASAFSAMSMSGLAIVGLTLRPDTRVMKTVSWVSLFLLAIYVLNVLFLYLHGANG